MNVPAYDFLTPRKIVFGWGKRAELGRLAASLGRRAWIVSGSRTLECNGTLDQLREYLTDAGVAAEHLLTISREPEVADVDHAVAGLRGHVGAGDMVIAVGGGAAIDLAKAVAALAPQSEPGSVLEYLEGVGTGRTINAAPLPVIAVPTTAGTGSEATKNAVISSFDLPFKKSLRDDRMMPQVALVDPELTTCAPPEVTAHSGLDAITQLIESYLSARAKPIPQSLCLAGLQGAVDALRRAYRDGQDRPAREIMAQAALFSGMALANSGLGLAHGVAAALGVVAKVAHGLACAVMLPAAMRVNRDAYPERWSMLAEVLCGRRFDDAASASAAAIDTIESLAAELAIPRRLRDLGVTESQLPALVTGSRGNSMSGNPRQLSDGELATLLAEML